MQITLLPPLGPSDPVVAVPAAAPSFTPGERLLATVMNAGLHEGTLLLLGGRQVPIRLANDGGPAGQTLPYPPGTTLRLEVVEGGPHPLLRLVSVESGPVTGVNDPAASESTMPGLPVSSATYGLAAAVFAAREGPDVRNAAVTFASWLPALVAAGVMSARQAEALARALAPLRAPAGEAADPHGAHDTEAAGRAIAERVSTGGLMLERRLADVVRHGSAAAMAAAAADLRARLAGTAHLLEPASPAFDEARRALAHLQDALVAEQARAAAHLADAGVVDVRLPLQVADRDGELRLRMRIGRDATDPRENDPCPWRQVCLDVDLDGLGRVQVRLGVTEGRVRSEFFVEDPDAADRIEARMGDLDAALQQAGFAEVLSRVVVDPVRACAPDTLPELPSQRSILDTRA